MSQADITLPNSSGSVYRAADNARAEAIVTDFSGSTAPSSPLKYQTWADESVSPTQIKKYSGTQWVTIGYFDTAGNAYTIDTAQLSDDSVTADKVDISSSSSIVSLSGSDELFVSDVDDANNVKKVTAQQIADLTSGVTAGEGIDITGGVVSVDIDGLPSVSAAAADTIMIKDVSDANSLKEVTAQSIADLSSGFDGVVTLRSSRTTTGSWTISGLTVGKPVFLGASNPSSSVQFDWRVTSGSNMAITSGGFFQLNDSALRGATESIVPTSSTLVIQINAAFGTIYAYQ